MRPAVSAGVYSLPGATLRWKGRDSPVSVVPGWMATMAPFGWRRRSSTDSVRRNWLSAAFEAR